MPEMFLNSMKRAPYGQVTDRQRQPIFLYSLNNFYYIYMMTLTFTLHANAES